MPIAICYSTKTSFLSCYDTCIPHGYSHTHTKLFLQDPYLLFSRFVKVQSGWCFCTLHSFLHLLTYIQICERKNGKKSRHDFWQDFYRNCVCDFDFRDAKADLTNDAEWNRNYTLWSSEQCLLSRCAMMIWRNTFFFFKSHLIKEVTKQVVDDLSQ